MELVCGLVAPAQQDQIQSVFHSYLKQANNHPGSANPVKMYSDAGFIVGNQHRERDGILLSFRGRIALDEIQLGLSTQTQLQPSSLSPAPINSANVAEHLLNRYQQSGPAALAGLNGIYMVLIWDQPNQTITVINDRYGIQPVYYWQTGMGCMISTQLKSFTWHPAFSKSLNPTAIFDLLATGQMLGEHTLFADVHALPPATILTFRDANLSLSTYWEPELYQPQAQTIPMDASLDRFTSLLSKALTRHVTGDSWLLLTGGLDSRLLAGALQEYTSGSQLKANTIGHRRSRDVVLAREIARAVNLEHITIPVNANYLAEYSAETVTRTEGNMNIFAGWILGEVDFLRANQVKQIITGVGAEMVSGRHWLIEQQIRDRSVAIQRMANVHWRFDKAASLLQPEVGAAAQAEEMRLLQTTLSKSPSEEPFSQYDYLHLRLHRRHPTGNILQDDVAVIEPFFDQPLVDFALGLPPAVRSHMYRKAIIRCYPDIAKIETTETGLPLQDAGRASKSMERQLERFLYRVQRKLGWQRGPLGDHPHSTIYPNHWLRTSSRDYALRLIHKLDRLNQYIDIKQAQQLVADHMAGKTHAYVLICALMTLSLWVDQIAE